MVGKEGRPDRCEGETVRVGGDAYEPGSLYVFKTVEASGNRLEVSLSDGDEFVCEMKHGALVVIVSESNMKFEKSTIYFIFSLSDFGIRAEVD